MGTQPIIHMRDYCPASPYGDSNERILLKIVNVEDELNHVGIVTNTIPRMEYPVFKKMKPASLYALIKQFLP